MITKAWSDDIDDRDQASCSGILKNSVPELGIGFIFIGAVFFCFKKLRARK
jgi:hypothetical protein